MATGAHGFCRSLPELARLRDAVEPARYRRLPDDWLIGLTDVRDSTAHLARGRYKEVNGVGVAAIAAVRNLHKPDEIPFVFGGDGATFCLPPEFRAAVEGALRATRRMARQEFGLDLRIGMVPHAEVRARGREVRVARLRLSRWIAQTQFLGGGLELVERLVKDDRADNPYRVAEEGPAEADFSGLECRWQDIPSPHEETVAWMFRAVGADEERRAGVLRRVVVELERTYGEERRWRPLHVEGLRLARDPRLLRVERGVRAFGRGPVGRLAYGWWLRVQIAGGRVLMGRGLRFRGADWGRYREDAVANADFRKIDDGLRVVLAGRVAQRTELVAALEGGFAPGELAWGHHVAGAAIMTCVIDRYEGEHFHFVDGADGGYAAAAREMKRRLAAMAVAEGGAGAVSGGAT